MASSIAGDFLDDTGPTENSSVSNVGLGYTDAQIQRAVCYAFAALALLGGGGIAAISLLGIFQISMVGCLYFASQVLDYRNPQVQQELRAQFTQSNCVKLYREHGWVNLLQVFTLHELQQKFHAEIQDPNTTFMNVLRQYDLQELYQNKIISIEHWTWLMNLHQQAKKLSRTVYLTKERWSKGSWLPTFNTSYHLHTAFANEPETYRMVEALDAVYKAQSK